MATVLTVASQTGGAGKTTTALNLGYMLSRLGERVLLIDADPQGGLAVASNLGKRTSVGLVQVLRGELACDSAAATTRLENLAILGSGVCEPTDTADLEAASRDGSLVTTIGLCARPYTYAIIDAPAGVGSIVAAALAASNATLLVLRLRTLNLKTLPSFLRLLRHVREETNPRLRLEGALVTMRDASSALESELELELQSTLPEEMLLQVPVPLDPRFEEASLRALPVAMLPGGREPARAYLALALELKERELLRRVGGDADELAEGLF